MIVVSFELAHPKPTFTSPEIKCQFGCHLSNHSHHLYAYVLTHA